MKRRIIALIIGVEVMGKGDRNFYCGECGARYPKWLGKCEDCGQWNTITENIPFGEKSKFSDAHLNLQNLAAPPEKLDRKLSDVGEFDRVLGGGIVAGSVALVGGDPGIGKSTLLLQISVALSQDYSCVYVSGEESAEQICMRAARLGASDAGVQLACETDVDVILNSLGSDVDFLVVDSIQTLQSLSVEAIPGTVSQVRACAYKLINFAKTTGTTVFLIGHVTKDGAIAGPKILEHMVDTVLYFEGERGSSYRILRTVKNRYGPCDELGIFEMQPTGLVGVTNPSVLFLTQRDGGVPGSVVFPGIEGTRPILVEVQALASKSYFASPRRTVVGWDINRLFTILAVIESKCKISFSDRDVYLSIAGGLKISEPACDLAAAISLLSARSGKVISSETCAFGEIGLTGEIRSVSRCSERLKEAEKLGLKKVILPGSSNFSKDSAIEIQAVDTLMHVIELLGIEYR
ncbi:MAG: DNA repair protein RadA [Holosporaceae bacterium]|jgi:DNA repair protein RadA/Sms|nr:DNA repair protein RadA [Holosporaceae bacterium]